MQKCETQDPKVALRAGFAKTGRLTQFLTPDDEGEAGESEEHRIESALYDLYRQLGYLQPLEEKLRGSNVDYTIPVMGLWIVNYKKTIYGNTKRFPVFVTAYYVKGEVWVECEYLLDRRMRYWEACLEFQKVSGSTEMRNLQKKDACATIKRKMLELHHNQKAPLLLMLQSDGVSRPIWKMISDSELSKAKRNDRYTLDKLWFDSAEANDGFKLDGRENGLRFIRVRGNEEVPDYISYVKENGKTKTVSGVYNYDDIFWSIAQRPNDPLFKNAYNSRSKTDKPGAEYKLTDMIEVYPMHLKPGDDPEEWVWLVHKLRSAAHQYKGTLRLPLPLHLAKKLEEYIG